MSRWGQTDDDADFHGPARRRPGLLLHRRDPGSGRGFTPSGPAPDELAYRGLLARLDPDQAREVGRPFGTVFAATANAGAGKTTTMISRLVRYAFEGHDPAGAVAISFTKRAARELRDRYHTAVVEALPNPEGKRSYPVIGTGHAFGVRLLHRLFGCRHTVLTEREGQRLLKGLATFQDLKPEFEDVRAAIDSLCARAETHLVAWPELTAAGALVRVHDVGRSARCKDSALRRIEDFPEQYARANWFSAGAAERRIRGETPVIGAVLRAAALGSHAAMAGMREEDFTRLLVELLTAKHAAAAIEFSDLLYAPVLLMLQHPQLLHRVRNAYSQFLVDEAQDMSALDYALVVLAAGFPDWSRDWPAGRGLMLVGDSKQSLYWWRGGMPLVMDHLDAYLEHPDVAFGGLRRNHRSGAGLVEATDAFAQTFGRRHAAGSVAVLPRDTPDIEIGRFRTTAQEDKGLVAKMRQKHAEGAAWGGMTVLARTNRDLEEVQAALIGGLIPFRWSSNRKVARSESFAFVNALLSLALNPRNVLAVPQVALGLRGVGETRVTRLQNDLIDLVRADPDLSASEALLRCPGKAADPVRLLLDRIVPDLRESLAASPVPSAMVRLRSALLEAAAWSDVPRPGASLSMSLEWAKLEPVLLMVEDVYRSLDADPEFVASAYERQAQDVCAALSLAREKGDAEGPEAADCVTLSTIHGFKGGEADCVFMIRLTRRAKVALADADGERCSFYVGATRARRYYWASSSELILDGDGGRRFYRPGVANPYLSDFVARWSAGQRLSA